MDAETRAGLAGFRRTGLHRLQDAQWMDACTGAVAEIGQRHDLSMGNVARAVGQRLLDAEVVEVGMAAAAAMGDSVQTASIAEKEPLLKTQLLTMGGSLLARFASTDNTRGIAILLDLGIDVNIPFPEGDAYWGIPPGSLPIHVAAWMLHPASVSLLVKKGAVIDQPNAKGNTPLMLAATSGSADIAQRLVGKGADVNAKNPGGVTALMIAAAGNRSDIAQILIHAGADPNARSEDGRTALMIAEANNSDAVAKLLKQQTAQKSGKST